MIDEQLVRSATLLFLLLNPFFMSVYLLDLIQDLSFRAFSGALVRGAGISSVVFVTFAWVGEFVFTQVLQVRFAAFLMFGGLVFLLVSLRFFFGGAKALRELRGQPHNLASTIAMPFMIGPGTISASIAAGSRLPANTALIAIVVPVFLSVLAVLGLKRTYDVIHNRHEKLITRYIDTTGRIMALVTGTIAVEMILHGIETSRIVD